ncbi:MAG: NAD(P)H-dependent oxidoreductase [Pseudomonadota bacterium]
MENKTLAILGSSRHDGATARLLSAVTRCLDAHETVDLNTLAIGPYCYDHGRAHDDFLPLAEKMQSAEALIFASPVYWYSMSAQMKTVFDRLTDLTEIYKPTGKALAGKAVFVVATGGSADAPACFIQPFADTAAYFDMRWGGLFYAPGADALTPAQSTAARAFADRIAGASHV